MRRHRCRVSAIVVTHVLCELIVSHLALTDYKRRLPAALLARLLLLAAALGRSLSFVAQRCDNAPSDETLRQAVLYNLPGPDLLRGRLLAALHALLPKRLFDRPHAAALDFHQRPYYGDKDTAGVRGGHREAGAQYFWTYATLVLLDRGLRFTVGLTPVCFGQSQEQIVLRLLNQARQAGVRLKYLLADRAFHDAAVFDVLQQQGVPFLVPMVSRGRADQGTGNTPFFRKGDCSYWSSYRWTTEPRRWDDEAQKMRRTKAVTVGVSICVVARGKKSPRVFAAWGIRWSPGQVARRYRTRFGIESSYRQLGECLANTSSRQANVRLLLVGLALLLRQYHCHVLAAEAEESGRDYDRPRRFQLRLADLKCWLLISVAAELNFQTQLPHPQEDAAGPAAA